MESTETVTPVADVTTFVNSSITTFINSNVTEDYIYEYDIEESDYIPVEDWMPLTLSYSLVLLVGLIGNALVIFSIAYYKRMRTTTNVFLFSLATADLLLVLVCIPIKCAAFLAFHWTFGEVLCKMVNYVQCQSMVCSVLTLTSISLERVIAVALPLKARTICTMRHAKLMVVIVWCVSFLLAIPTAVSVKHIEVGERFKAFWCVKEFSSFQFHAFYELYMLVLLFVVPMCVMIVTYTIIGVKVWRFTDMRADMRQGRVIAPTSKERIHQSMSNPESCLLSPHSNGEGRPSVRIERKKDLQEDTKTTKQLVLMLIIVVVLFALCWGPILINNVLVAFRHLPELHYGHLKHLRAAFNLMSYFNSCINPIVYAFMSKNFRQSFKFAICACLKGKAFVRAYRFSVSIASTRTSTISNGHLRRGISAHRDKSSSSGNENTHTHVVTDDDIVEMRSMTHPLV